MRSRLSSWVVWIAIVTGSGCHHETAASSAAVQPVAVSPVQATASATADAPAASSNRLQLPRDGDPFPAPAPGAVWANLVFGMPYEEAYDVLRQSGLEPDASRTTHLTVDREPWRADLEFDEIDAIASVATHVWSELIAREMSTSASPVPA